MDSVSKIGYDQYDDQYMIEKEIKRLYREYSSSPYFVMTRKRSKHLFRILEKYNEIMESSVSNGNTGEEIYELLTFMIPDHQTIDIL